MLPVTVTFSGGRGRASGPGGRPPQRIAIGKADLHAESGINVAREQCIICDDMRRGKLGRKVVIRCIDRVDLPEVFEKVGLGV